MRRQITAVARRASAGRVVESTITRQLRNDDDDTSSEHFPKKSGGSTSKLLEEIPTFSPFGSFLELQQLFGALEGVP